MKRKRYNGARDKSTVLFSAWSGIKSSRNEKRLTKALRSWVWLCIFLFYFIFAPKQCSLQMGELWFLLRDYTFWIYFVPVLYDSEFRERSVSTVSILGTRMYYFYNQTGKPWSCRRASIRKRGSKPKIGLCWDWSNSCIYYPNLASNIIFGIQKPPATWQCINSLHSRENALNCVANKNENLAMRIF